MCSAGCSNVVQTVRPAVGLLFPQTPCVRHAQSLQEDPNVAEVPCNCFAGEGLVPSWKHLFPVQLHHITALYCCFLSFPSGVVGFGDLRALDGLYSSTRFPHCPQIEL